MALALPKYSNWKALSRSPASRKISRVKSDIVGEFLAAYARAYNFVVGDVIGGLVKISAVKIWSIITTGAIFLMNFNWNIADEDLEARWKAAETVWWGQLGSTIGTALGWVTCGVIPSAVIFSFNRALAAHVLMNVGEEAFDEMVDELGLLMTMTVRNAANRRLAEAFIGFRWLVKNAANGEEPDTLMGQLVQNYLNDFPQLKEAAQSWGNKGAKPWVLSQKIEEFIENLPIEQKYVNFLEEMVEQFGDSCIEAGYVVAGSIDEYIANQKIVNDAQQGQPNTVVITPNRKAPDERLILHGTTEQLKPAITQTLAQYQLINNKDIGYDLGQPLIERAHKQISEYVIKLFLKNKQKRPYGRDSRQTEITINSANPLKFTDYDKVIRALGGGNDQGNFGYDYGNFLCIAQMSDGSILKLYSNNRENVISRLEAVAELSTAQIQTLNVTEEIKDYQRRRIDGLAKDYYKVYPWKMEVLRKTRVYNDYDKSYNSQGQAKATKQGYFDEIPYSLELWQGSKPSNWDEIIRELTAPIPPT